MTIDFRRTRVALLLALTPLALAVCPPALAQQNAAQNGNAAAGYGNAGNTAAARPDDDQTLGPTEQDHGAAMDTDAARMRGAAHESDLLGGPDPYGDPYRKQFEDDSNGTAQANLINSENVPMNGTAPNRKQGAKQDAGAALGGAALAGKPMANEAQAQPRTPGNAAKSVYKGSADPVNPEKQQQIYRSPW
ncbi:MAG TPA: hypothetical protein VKS80_01695 [Trinickia sp.]|nr:hypothetical protein [Trinickia sp.]